MLCTEDQIKENIAGILEKMTAAAVRGGRTAGDVRLMAVTKTKPVETIQALARLGMTCFGENYPDEIAEKASAFAALGLQPAMIGHLQSRKAKIVVDHCSALHSLDRFDVAEKLERLCAERDRVLPCFLECNVGDEESKSGWHFADDTLPADFLQDFEKITALPHLRVTGLMTLPPFAEVGETNRVYFARMRRIAAYLNDHMGGQINELSMGTSSDYEVAVEEGATIIRIGTALVGAREYKKN